MDLHNYDFKIKTYANYIVIIVCVSIYIYIYIYIKYDIYFYHFIYLFIYYCKLSFLFSLQEGFYHLC